MLARYPEAKDLRNVNPSLLWLFTTSVFDSIIDAKVLWPHRATLELRNTPNGWEIGQLKLSGNRLPGSTLQKVIAEWFQQVSDKKEIGKQST